MSVVCVFQVALSVAAEFWEQGDLERTVLEQQPIVSLQVVVVNMCVCICGKICKCESTCQHQQITVWAICHVAAMKDCFHYLLICQLFFQKIVENIQQNFFRFLLFFDRQPKTPKIFNS